MQNHKALAVLEIVTGVGIILFWIAFFTVGLAPENPPEGYFIFEHSFPFPDVILCLCLIASGVLLLKQDSRGKVLALMGAGGLMFLGMLDFSFNLQNGMYTMAPSESIPNMCINAWCTGFGLVLGIRVGRDVLP